MIPLEIGKTSMPLVTTDAALDLQRFTCRSVTLLAKHDLFCVEDLANMSQRMTIVLDSAQTAPRPFFLGARPNAKKVRFPRGMFRIGALPPDTRIRSGDCRT